MTSGATECGNFSGFSPALQGTVLWTLDLSRQTPDAATISALMSGRQDSNLRPLVPQTSTHFQMSVEFDLEWFCGESVGMTSRARVMESAGIDE